MQARITEWTLFADIGVQDAGSTDKRWSRLLELRNAYRGSDT